LVSSDKTARPIRRLLIANRGEIARRIIRSAHDMGIETVAVFATADAEAPFVSEAGQAIALQGTTAAESYLDVAKVIAAAQLSGADAIHPGYGFLAENAAFARAVIDADLVWVGPSPHAIASMGDKLAAKKIMADVGVPTLPTAEVDEGADLASAADQIGYPVLVKASAGGGGKGMRVVHAPDELNEAVAGAGREALAAFGDGTVFIEKYLPAPRHIEIQVLGDEQGNRIHLFERECSIQRRHQKIIEEAPSPALTPELRNSMGAAALAAAAAVDYVSAGTVEFLLDDSGDHASFYFLEMNTRIQVEHPVTEEITGIDLVREQLRIAMGEPLGIEQSDVRIAGHAIEARLYAEDPASGFLPATGTLVAFEVPPTPDSRVDTGVQSGSVVSVDFDPMLAKVIVHAPTRREAAARLALVLQRTVLAGVTTNRDFLVATLRTPAFVAGDTTTDFIERVAPATAFVPDRAALVETAIAATMALQAKHRTQADALRFMRSGYRNSSMPAQEVHYAVGDHSISVQYRSLRLGGFTVAVTVDETVGEWQAVQVDNGSPDDGSLTVQIDTRRVRYRITPVGDGIAAHGPAGTVVLSPLPRFPDHAATDVAGGQTAPMPGKVLAVHVAIGDDVSAGQPLVVMEAMKMEHTITSPVAGTVTELRCSTGDQVDNGQILVVVQSD